MPPQAIPQGPMLMEELGMHADGGDAGSPQCTAIGHPPVQPSTALHLNFFYQRPAALSPFAGPGTDDVQSPITGP